MRFLIFRLKISLAVQLEAKQALYARIEQKKMSQLNFRAKRKIVLDLRRTKSSDNLHMADPTEATETEELASASKTDDLAASGKKAKEETLRFVAQTLHWSGNFA